MRMPGMWTGNMGLGELYAFVCTSICSCVGLNGRISVCGRRICGMCWRWISTSFGLWEEKSHSLGWMDSRNAQCCFTRAEHPCSFLVYTIWDVRWECFEQNAQKSRVGILFVTLISTIFWVCVVRIIHIIDYTLY